MKGFLLVIWTCLVAVSAYYYGRFDEAKRFEYRIDAFGTRVSCADPEHVVSRSLDLKTGEYKCRYPSFPRKHEDRNKRPSRD